MVETKRNFNDPKDYKERFEFRLIIGNNIICQRYFRINDFNPACLSSFDLADTIQNCGKMIDEDLKSKTRAYLEIVAPRIFENEKEMNEFLSDPKHKEQMVLGEGIVLRDPDAPNYTWGKCGEPVLSPTQFSDGEFSTGIKEENRVQHKLVFLDNGREVCATVWEGVYPRYIRKAIDLSNKGPKFENSIDIYSLGFDAYLRYKITEGKSDLVFRIIKEICATCSRPTRKDYTLSDKYGNTEYRNSESERDLYRRFVLENDFYKDYPKVSLYDNRNRNSSQPNGRRGKQEGEVKKNKAE